MAAAKTVEVVYVGPHGGVLVPELSDEEIAPGNPVTVPAELGERLLRQKSNWATAPAPRNRED